MKASIFKIFIFLFTLAGGYYTIYYFLFNTHYKGNLSITYLQKKIPLKPSIMGKAFQEIEKEKNLDILFLGSSHCYRAFDPVYFEQEGYKVFNLGSSSQTPINSYHLLKKYISKTKNVILEIYPVTYSISGNESFVEMVSATSDYSFLTGQALGLKEFFPLQILSLKPFIDQKIAEKKLDKCIYRKGYVQVTDSAYKRKVLYKPITLSNEGLEFQLNYLYKIIELCNKNKIQLILTYAPLPDKFKFTNEVYFKTKLYRIISENKLIFIDMSRKHNLNDGYNFYDDDHLNASGVRLYNKALIANLKSVIKQ